MTLIVTKMINTPTAEKSVRYHGMLMTTWRISPKFRPKTMDATEAICIKLGRGGLNTYGFFTRDE